MEPDGADLRRAQLDFPRCLRSLVSFRMPCSCCSRKENCKKERLRSFLLDPALTGGFSKKYSGRQSPVPFLGKAQEGYVCIQDPDRPAFFLPIRTGASMACILVIDEDPSVRAQLKSLLQGKNYEILEASNQTEAFNQVEEKDIDLILSEFRVQGQAVGMELLERITHDDAATEVILLTRHGDIQNAVEAIRRGAYDVLVKPVDTDMVRLSVKRALERKRLKRQVRHLSSVLKRRFKMEGIVYRSRQMEEILRLVQRVSQVEATVLIQGESGTGKELIARAAHAQSPRKTGPFSVIDCGTIPANLLESELFGHKRGAFTGAESSRKGLFEVTDGGTLLLDEVGELPFSLQVKLLRVLQEKEIRPVGSDRSRKIDVRILAATNKDLQEEIHKGRFREDLFYRLNVINIRVLPLRERPDDILALAQHFLQKHAKRVGLSALSIDPSAANLMLRYPWPGNVRELENAMERAVALVGGDVLRPEDLPDMMQGNLLSARIPMDAELSLEEVEKRYILHVLEQQRGNRIRAARVLGIGRNTLWRKLKAYGVKDG
jgi:two-component system response regulator AtoC